MPTKIISLALGILIGIPIFAVAQTTDQATIATLQQQLASLQQQLATQASATTGSFDRDLFFGLRNDLDVSRLQKFLTDQGFYSGPISGNFLILTQGAVKKFQAAHGIRQTGYFGPITRNVVNNILAGIKRESGSFYIEPSSAQISVGESVPIKAYYQPSMPPCTTGGCPGYNPAPQEVNASFTSSDPSIADITATECAPPPPGVPPVCSGNTRYLVRGISHGTTTITAVYMNGTDKFVATMNVVVLQTWL